MTRALALLAVVFCALSLMAQAPAPLKPGPEQKNSTISTATGLSTATSSPVRGVPAAR